MTMPNNLPTTSTGVSRNRPDVNPTEIPTTTAINMAKKDSSSVAAPFCSKTCVNGRWSTIVSPKSNVATSVRYSMYCAGMERSSPAASRRSWICSCVRRPPRAALIGSPGATLISRKTIVSRIRIIGIPSAIRVRTYLRSDVVCFAIEIEPIDEKGGGSRPRPSRSYSLAPYSDLLISQ